MGVVDDPDAIGVALEVAAAIESVRGEYFVGGSVASSLQGEPRATNDLDIVVSLPLGRNSELATALGPLSELAAVSLARTESSTR